MNRASGKILLRETGVGIPNLVVTLYDVDSNTLPDDVFQSKRSSLVNFWEQLHGDRLGSVLTDNDGAFVLEYQDVELKKKRPDLLLYITAPEGSDPDGYSSVLHVSSGIRQNAGRIESYLIRLTSDQLKKASVPLPSLLTPEIGSPKTTFAKFAGIEKNNMKTPAVLEKFRAVLSLDPISSVRISEMYVNKSAALQRSQIRNRIPENGFRLAVPMISSGTESSARIKFDPDGKKWYMQKDGENSEIKFGGFVSSSELNSGSKSGAGTHLILNEQAKEFSFVIFRTPVRLTQAENHPGNLFIETFKRRFVLAKKQIKPEADPSSQSRQLPIEANHE